jgi:hypothetical protein
VNVEVPSTGWTPCFRHVLREDLPGFNTLYKNRTEVTNQRRDEISRLESVRCANRGCFLAQRAKDTTDDFGLPVEVHQPFFYQPRQLQKSVQVKQLFRLESCLSSTTQRLSIGGF